MRKITLLIISLLMLSVSPTITAQSYTDQNGIKTSVISGLYADATQARRFEVATVAYNSYNWQPGGIIIAEIFNHTYGTAYEKYSIEIGYNQGGQGTPEIKLLDSQGMHHYAKITLGEPYDLTTMYGNYVNRAISIYIDVANYSHYRVKLTYIHSKVNELTSPGQIKINDTPTRVNIPNFEVSRIINRDIDYSGSLKVRGSQKHFITGGYVGIGTENPQHKLDVLGTIRATEVKVESAWADFVFDKDYKLPTLQEVETHINEYKRLPDIPSEKQVKEEGINIGEMQAKLLQKIEELTLYVIEQNNRIEKQNEEIETLKNIISTK